MSSIFALMDLHRFHQADERFGDIRNYWKQLQHLILHEIEKKMLLKKSQGNALSSRGNKAKLLENGALGIKN
ncbi:hypothetical protein HPP92_007384 [Vanilla planifolia]|uniref:Uncharacterized protein n=1 Tax=Vanilla planifolia TaxID=51239 RepID=A0A835RE06_VANPL|nr:hypothetical protein HPP92_007384 [Vanilla planifolia]